ncbi:DUF2570 family protein [Morganella morganii]
MSRWVTIACSVMMIALFVMTRWQSGKIDELKAERDSLSEKLSAQQVINTTTLTAIAINHRISLDNIKAKQTEDTEHVNVKTVIKTVFKDSECAVTPVPVDVVGELRKYADGIRSRSGGADSATTDRGL